MPGALFPRGIVGVGSTGGLPPKMKTHRTTVMVPAPGKRKADVSADQKPSKRSKPNTVASSLPAPARKSAAGGQKRKAVDDLEDEPPRRSKRLSKLSKSKKSDAATAAADSTTTTTKDAAEKSKKRSRPAESEGGEKAAKRKKLSESKESNEGATSPSSKSRTNAVKSKVHPVNGLINHGNACFSNVVIQLLDASLQNIDLDAVLGESSDALSFGRTKRECKKAIKAAAKAGKTDEVSAAKHLRSVLANLRTEHEDAAAPAVSAYLFQSVVAWGAAADADRAVNDLSARQQLSGDTQEDCFEYYQKVLEILLKDLHLADRTALEELFEVRSVTTHRCRKLGCGYTSTPPPADATSNYHDISVVRKPSAGAWEFSQLWSESKSSRVETRCPKCSAGHLMAVTKFTKEPANLVVKMNRATYDSVRKEPSKVTTAIDFDTPKVKLQDSTYELNAVIFHRGRSIAGGHYTIFRKQDEDWFLLDDRKCIKKTSADVQDTARGGQSAMLLLTKVKE